MTITTVNGMFFPEPWYIVGSTNLTNILLDAAGEKAAFILQAPKTGLIRKVHFRVGTVTTAQDTDVRLETVSTTDGNPTGTLFGTTTQATVTAASITSNAWITTPALTADASVTKGDIIAVVIAPTGTPSYNVSTVTGMVASSAPTGFPYGAHFTASWAKLGEEILVALEYSDSSFAYSPHNFPVTSMSVATTYNVDSTPDENGLKFTLTAPVRVSGAWIAVDRDGDCDVVLYGSDGATVLASVSLDKDIDQSTTPRLSMVMFSSSVSLLANTAYRLVIKPTTVTSLTLYGLTVNAASLLDQMGGGQALHLTTRTDSGAWTDTTTSRPHLGLIIDGIDDGVSAGGAAQFRMGSVG